MDEMEHFVVENNVSMFFSKLAGESEIGRRATLSRLLVEEENKFGKQVELLNDLQSYIARSDALIARHRTLLAEGGCAESDRVLIGNVLTNIIAFRAALGTSQELAARRLDDLGSNL